VTISLQSFYSFTRGRVFQKYPIVMPPVSPIPLLVLLGTHASLSAATLNITPGVNNMPIQNVVLTIGGMDMTQLTEATGVTNATSNAAVNVKSVSISDGSPVLLNLNFFNTEGAQVVNVNPQLSSIAGVGVFNNGVKTLSNNNQANYAQAFAETSLDTDLRNFTFHDYLAPGPPTGNAPDLDILFYRALNLDDYLLVSERWGNSVFQVTALMADGSPYATANVLQLGGAGPSSTVGYGLHDWNTGIASKDLEPTQAQTLTVFSVEKFFEGTPRGLWGPVYGLRIDNNGEADVKILGISNDTFSDNPVIPEPSTLVMVFSASLLFLGSRNRTRSVPTDLRPSDTGC
jgi:hypothetical protein